MAVTIKYKDLTRRLVKEMTIEQIRAVRKQLVADFNAMRTETFHEKRAADELMAQIGLISDVINEKSKEIEHKCEKCEKCGKLTTFSRNMCECCFDAEVDRYYDGGRDEDE